MSIRKSFTYDPIRQGYDTNSWRTISGAPALVGSRLSIDNSAGIGASAIHYVDFVKGEVVFDVNVPTAPTPGTSRSFGASSPNTSSYVLFSFGATLTATCSDGITTTSSSAITWSDDWTSANTIFKIRWEAGGAKFFINGTQVAVICDDSVPYGPLSLYFSDDSDSSMTVGDIVVRATQSYVANLKTSDSSVPTIEGKISMYQGVTITENTALLVPELFVPYSTGSFAQSVGVSDVISVIWGTAIPLFTQAITVSENLVMFKEEQEYGTDYDSITVSEVITLEKISY
jgi:hypothetical protein